MWSMSITMPSRIASLMASSPATVMPFWLRSPIGKGRVPGSGCGSAMPRVLATGSTFSQNSDAIVTGFEIVSSGTRPVNPSSVTGTRPRRCQELTMNITSYRAMPPKALSERWMRLTCTMPRSRR